MSELVPLIKGSIDTWTFSYYLWATVFYILCVVSIAMPLVITAGLSGDRGNKILGILTAVSVGVLNWANLGIIAGNFDQARSDMTLALVDFSHDEDKLKQAYKDARARVRSISPGLPQTSTTTGKP